MCSNRLLPAFASSFVSSRIGNALRACLLLAALAEPAGCMAQAVDEQPEIATNEEALCPAPGATVAVGSPQVVFQNAYPQNVQVTQAIAGDFNGDGLLDAVFIADGDKQRLVLMVGNGYGVSQGTISTMAVPWGLYNPQSGTSLDYDNDGDLDIAYVTQGGNSLVIALNDGSGSFSVATTLAIPSTYGMRRAAAGDFDGDGRTDIAIPANTSRTIRIVLNTPTGLSLQPAISTGNGAPLDISAADLNRDGQIDLVAGLSFVSQPFFVLQGNGDGTFTQVAAPLPKNQGINGAYSVGLVVADLDADEGADVAYVDANTRSVHVFRNNSGAGVSFANEADSGGGPYSLNSASLGDIAMAAGDFDVDGRPDLAVIGDIFTVGAQLHVLRNTGAPGAPLSFAASAGPWLVNSNGKTTTKPRGFAVGPFHASSCGARADVLFSSNNDTVSDWSVQYVPNTTE